MEQCGVVSSRLVCKNTQNCEKISYVVVGSFFITEYVITGIKMKTENWKHWKLFTLKKLVINKEKEMRYSEMKE